MSTTARIRPLLVAVVVLLAAVAASGAAASPPISASGTLTYQSATFNSIRSAGGNTIIDLSATVSYTGTFSGTSTFTLVLHDATQGWTQTITKTQSGLARSSAEVITEAPSSRRGVLPLADFGTVHYSVSDANGGSLAGLSPTEIIMVDNSGAQTDSTSAISSTGAFSNTWIRSS